MEFKGKKVQIDFSSDDDIPAAGFQLKYNITRLQQGTQEKFEALLKAIWLRSIFPRILRGLFLALILQSLI